MTTKRSSPLIRSLAAEYLSFVASPGGAEISVEMRYEDENIWLPRKMMATLYGVTVLAINQHLKRIFADNELDEALVIKQYLTTAADGKNYRVEHYTACRHRGRGFQDRERACGAVSKVDQPDRQGLHDPGLDHGCGASQGGRRRAHRTLLSSGSSKLEAVGRELEGRRQRQDK